MDFEFEPCSVCNDEDGLYCCKICNLKYCSDHLCLHLNVAWETNTWTARNSGVVDETDNSTIQICNFNNARESETNNVSREIAVSPNAKTLLSYTEPELEAQLEFIMLKLEELDVSWSGVRYLLAQYLGQNQNYTLHLEKMYQNAKKHPEDSVLNSWLQLNYCRVKCGKVELL